MTSSSEDPKPRIIVDEDWKSQVEKEREAAAGAKQAAAGGHSEPVTQKPTPAAPEQLPPASFPLLVSTFATQAMVYLGQFPDGPENQTSVELPLAQHCIDMLAMLEEKTKGNLSNEENHMLQAVLHELRMTFIQVDKAR